MENLPEHGKSPKRKKFELNNGDEQHCLIDRGNDILRSVVKEEDDTLILNKKAEEFTNVKAEPEEIDDWSENAEYEQGSITSFHAIKTDDVIESPPVFGIMTENEVYLQIKQETVVYELINKEEARLFKRVKDDVLSKEMKIENKLDLVGCDPDHLPLLPAKKMKNESQIKLIKEEEISTKEDVSQETGADQYCKKCDNRFLTMDDFKKHKKSCLQLDKNSFCVQEKGYKCNKCNYFTTVKSIMKVHLKTHTANTCYKCEECNYITKNVWSLNQHARIHSGKKPFKCSACSYSTISLWRLRVHKKVHSGEKSFKCSHCSFSTANSSNLKRHKKTHTKTHNEEKFYNRSQCTYSARTASDVKRHGRIHSGEKPYKCSQCDYSAAQSISLKVHMYVHSGEKPYKCAHCSYSSAKKSHIEVHMKVHSNKLPHKCSQCDFSTNKLNCFKSHIKAHSKK